VGLGPVAKVERAAAVGQPAHDHAVAPDNLLPVDPQVLPLLVRTAGHHQTPGDQGSGVARPAGLYRQGPKVHVRRLDHLFLGRRRAHTLGGHIEHLAKDRQRLPGGLEALGRVRLLQERQQFADLAQRLDGLRAHAQCNPLRGSEEVTEDGGLESLGVLEQQRRSAGPEDAVADLRHLQLRIHLEGNPAQLATGLEKGNEVAQVAVSDLLSHGLANILE